MKGRIFERVFVLAQNRFGSCALNGKTLLVSIIKNDKIDDYFRLRLSKGKLCPAVLQRD